MAVGRISGPLLKSNLIRNGIDLAFETDLLYLDVNNQRIGVKNSSPQYELDISGDLKTSALQAVNQADIGNVTIQGDTVSSSTNYLNLATLDSVVSLKRLEVDSIRIEGNVIETQDTDADLDFRPNGTGSVSIYSDLDVTGNVYVSGNITADGDITVGDETTDSVTFNAEVVSDIVPAETNTYDLGSDPDSGGQEWAETYTNNLYASTSARIADVEISSNRVESTQSNQNLVLESNGTGTVTVPVNDVVLQQDLAVQGNTDLQDVQVQGDVTVNGDITQTGSFSVTGDVTISQALTVDQEAQFEEIKIDDNFITTTSSNSDLELRAAGTGYITVPENDVVITQSLTVTDSVNADFINASLELTAPSFTNNNIEIVNNRIQTTDSNSNLELEAAGTGVVLVDTSNVVMQQDLAVQGFTQLNNTGIQGNVNQTGNVVQVGDYNITGSVSISGTLETSSSAQLEEILIDDNIITTTSSNADLELIAAGTGSITVPENDVEIANNLTVLGDMTVTNINSSQTVTANRFTTGDIVIDDNYITTTNSNSDLELRTAGAGFVNIEQFSVLDSTISTQNSFIINPGSEYTILESTGALRVPIGTTAQRPTIPESGQIRFNSDLERFEGFNGTYWIKIDGVEDVDGDTSVTAELAPGANDNTIRFTANGITSTTVDGAGLKSDQIIVDSIQLDNSKISTITTDTDLELQAQGTGSVMIDNFAIKDGVVTNTVPDGVTVFENVNNGYVKFQGTGGLVIPVGNNSNRPPLDLTEVGMTRFNTQEDRVEVYNGFDWISLAGSAAGISRGDAEDIAFSTVIQFG